MEALWLLAAPLTVNLLRLPERAQLAEGGACEEVWLNTVAMGLLLGTEDTRGDWTKCSSEEDTDRQVSDWFSSQTIPSSLHEELVTFDGQVWDSINVFSLTFWTFFYLSLD